MIGAIPSMPTNPPPLPLPSTPLSHIYTYMRISYKGKHRVYFFTTLLLRSPPPPLGEVPGRKDITLVTPVCKATTISVLSVPYHQVSTLYLIFASVRARIHKCSATGSSGKCCNRAASCRCGSGNKDLMLRLQK
jgi:hypothetical protein